MMAQTGLERRNTPQGTALSVRHIPGSVPFGLRSVIDRGIMRALKGRTQAEQKYALSGIG